MNVVVAGGGTAGHIDPALNLADEIMRRHPNARITALGTSRGLETTLVPERGYPLELIPAVPMPRRINLDAVTLPRRLRQSIKATRDIFDRVDAQIVVGFGGYVAIPAYLAARGRVPFIVHEANAKPGLANRVGARFADAVAETVPGSLPNAKHTGVPLRSAITNLDRAAMRAQARDHFGLEQDARVILIFGGSQGAQSINGTVAQCLTSGVFDDVTVIHAVGMKNAFPAEPAHNYRPYAYLDRMDLAYAAADFVISRSGAMTVAEIAAVGLPACFVPFPIGNGEQSLNALPVVNAQGAVLVKDQDFNVDYVQNVVMPIMHSPQTLSTMGSQSKSVGRADASARMADLVEEVLARVQS
jgi:UDP-N-acetylglucosamine--N-acetylmuramyl-(pentapeptide) pyrophosphoryl-undecaprenol N-acetylglucosamine transferase